MNDSKELLGLCLKGERQPITFTLAVLRKEVGKINVKQEGSLWRKGPMEMEHTDTEKQREMKFHPPASQEASCAAPGLTPHADTPAPACELQQAGLHGRPAPGSSLLPAACHSSAFAPVHRAITFGPFYLIGKLYSENKEHDIQAQKLQKVIKMQIAKENGGHYIQKFLEEKQCSIQKKSEEDDLRLGRALQQHEKNRLLFIENVRQRHTQFLESKKQKAFEYSVGQDFNAQHAALTRGLLKLDRCRKLDDGLKERQRIAEESREQMKKNKQLIKSFQDQRQLRIQTENLAQKAIMSSLVSQKTNKRLAEAKAHAARVRDRRAGAGPAPGSRGSRCPYHPRAAPLPLA